MKSHILAVLPVTTPFTQKLQIVLSLDLLELELLAGDLLVLLLNLPCFYMTVELVAVKFWETKFFISQLFILITLLFLPSEQKV